ncbi:hypothetical protein Tco_0201085 [Tanacetum coccineum]
MTTLAKFMILSGADNRPPMLEKHLTKRYDELSATEKIQADCDLKENNIILQGLPTDVYSLVNHHKVAKDLWERVRLLMQGTSLTKSKLVRDLHTTNFDQLHAYLEQHELHANEVRIIRERNQDPLVLVANHQMTPSHFNTFQSSYNNPQFQQQFSPSKSPQYGSIHPTQHYSTTYPSTPHAITYPSTPHPNAYSSTVHQDACPQPQSIPQIKYTVSTVNQQTHLAEFPQIDSGLAVPVLGRQSSFAAGTSRTRANISGIGGNNSGQQRVVKCFNCHGEAQGSGKVLNEEELEFLADPRVAGAKAVLMANLSSYGSDVLSEVPHSENTHNDMLNQSMQKMQYSEQTHLVNYPENEIIIDSNIIPYSQYLLETQNAVVQDTNSSTQQDAMILYVFE